jgi:hypothetical protein
MGKYSGRMIEVLFLLYFRVDRAPQGSPIISKGRIDWHVSKTDAEIPFQQATNLGCLLLRMRTEDVELALIRVIEEGSWTSSS